VRKRVVYTLSHSIVSFISSCTNSFHCYHARLSIGEIVGEPVANFRQALECLILRGVTRSDTSQGLEVRGEAARRWAECEEYT
jgi:hypothetical protein